MRKRKDFYAFVLSLISDEVPIQREAIRQACREHFHISDEEWSVKKKNGRDLKYSNRLDFVIQDLRDVGLIDLNNSLFRVTAIGLEAKSWKESDLVKYVKRGLSESRKNKRHPPKGNVGDGGMKKEMQRDGRMFKMIRRGAIAMVCASILGLLLSDEHDMFYGVLLLISILLLLWKKRKIAASATDPETRRPKSCPNPIPDTPGAEPTKPTSPSEPEHMPIEPPKKPMPGTAEPKGLTPDGQGSSIPKPIDEKTSYFEKYLDVVGDRHGVAAKERLRSDVEDLFGSGPESADNKKGRIAELLEECKKNGRPQKVNGLVVGRVQSGKTQNYIGLMLKAIDEGYNLILILTSNNVALGAQTRNRVVAEFEGVGLKREKFNLISDFPREARRRNLPGVDDKRVTICFALKEKHHLGSSDNPGGVHGWLNKKNKDALKSSRMLIIDDEADSYTQNTNANLTRYWDYSNLMQCAEDIKAEPETRNGVTGWAAVAEWVGNIAKNGFRTDDTKFKDLQQEVSEWGLRSREEFVNRILSNDSKFLHVLRLDEERGFAKLDGYVKDYFTRSKSGRSICGGAADFYDAFFYILKYGCDIKPERSTINQAICGIVDDYAYQKLVYVGYTATPYANVLNERFGAGNPLEPAFVQSLTISPNYLGLERIFGSYWEAAEGTESLSPFVVPCEDGSIEDDRMDQPLAWTFCCAAMRSAIREEFNDERRDSRAWRWTTMMVNLSSRVDEHTSQFGKMQQRVNDKLADREGFKSECLAVFDSLQSKGISADVFKKTFPDYDGGVRDLDRSIVEKKISDLIDRRRVGVLVLNGASENVGNYDRYVQAEEYIKKNPNEKISDDHVWIVVGGNKLSRGLTFDGLVTSVFDRESPAVCVDTLTQMGRWFGYRTNYELMPRIWMPKVTAFEFKKIADLERDWHSRVKDMFDNREPVKKLRFMDIGRDMSGRSAAQMRDGGENPLIVNEYRVGEDTLKEAMAGLNDFLQNLGKEMDRPSAEYGEWYDKWHCWRGVLDATVRDYIKNAQERLSPRLAKRVAHFMDEDLSAEKVFDVVLENPDSKGRTISSAQGLERGYEIHVMGASDIHFIGQDLVAAEKFHGQYDALKAVVPKAVLDVIKERHPGSKLNDSEAFKEIFEAVERRRLPVNPILRVGFINGPGALADGQPIVTLSIYWPLHDRRPYIEPSTIQTLQRVPVLVERTPADERRMTAVGMPPTVLQTDVQSSSRAPLLDSREGGDSVETRICELINKKGIIAEPELKKNVIGIGVSVSDYERAIRSFKDKAINNGIKPGDTPLSNHEVFVSLEELKSLVPIVRLQGVNRAEYLRLLNAWLVDRVNEAVKDCLSKGGREMNLDEFIRFLQDEFPHVFSSRGIEEFFWDRYVERMGIIDDSEDEENDS